MLSIYFNFFIGVIISLGLLLIIFYNMITKKERNYKVIFSVLSVFIFSLLLYLIFSNPSLSERKDIYQNIVRLKSKDVDKIILSKKGWEKEITNDNDIQLVLSLLQNTHFSLSQKPKSNKVWGLKIFSKKNPVFKYKVFENTNDDIIIELHSGTKIIGSYKNNNFKVLLRD